ncbi:sugar phosphate isomerase/epimerase [bacterium]|nr:sugar phosphate isomerase/epimerase [bacterium]
MRIGIIDYLLRARDSMLPHLARELGFDSIELAIDKFGDPGRLMFDPERGDDMVYLTKSAGVGISSVNAIQFLQQNLLDPDPVRRRPTGLLVKGLFERSLAIGADVVVLPLLGASEVRGDDELLALTELLPIWTRWAESLDIAVAIKTSLFAEQILRMLEDFPAPHLGLSFDPALLAAMGRDPVAEWDKLAPRVHHVHLQDRTRAGLAASLGEGDAPLPTIIEAIVARQYAGAIVLSTPAGDHPKENARRNRVYLERLLTVAHRAKTERSLAPTEP